MMGGSSSPTDHRTRATTSGRYVAHYVTSYPYRVTSRRSRGAVPHTTATADAPATAYVVLALFKLIVVLPAGS